MSAAVTPASSKPRRALLAVAGLTVIAFGLRALVVGQPAVYDELYLYRIVHDHGLGHVIRVVHDTESTPPLYFLLAWASDQIIGDGFFAIKLPSLLLGTATVPLIYLFGVRTVGRTAALIGAAIFALSSFEIFYATEGRAYATIAFLSVASTLTLLRMLEDERRSRAVIFGLVTLALLYTHYTAVFVLGVQLAWALWFHRDRVRRLLAVHAAIALAYVPWIPSFIFQSHDSAADRVEALYKLTPSSYVRGLGQAWIGHPFLPLKHVPGRLGGALIGAGLVGSAAAAVADRLSAHGRLRCRREALLVFLLALATPVCALLYSLGPSSVFLPRYMSASVPAAVLATGAVVAAARRPVTLAVACAAVLAGFVIGAVRTVEPESRRPDFRAAAHELDHVARPGDPVIELTIFKGPPAEELGFSFRRRHDYFPSSRPLEPAFARGQSAGRLFIVIVKEAEGYLQFFGLRQRGFDLIARRSYPGFQHVMLLTYAPRERRRATATGGG
jgi:hypothetical protein